MANELKFSKERVLEAARTLSVTERIDVYTALRDELRGHFATAAGDTSPHEEFSAEQLAELDRRSERHKVDSESAVDWDQIDRELIERYGTGHSTGAFGLIPPRGPRRKFSTKA